MSELDLDGFKALVRQITARIDKTLEESDNGPATVLALSTHLHQMLINAIKANQLPLVENTIDTWELFLKQLRNVIEEIKKKKAAVSS
jgi:flagellar biosynthesis component FlhA